MGLALPRVLVWRQSVCVRWGRIPLGRKAYNGRVERRHRTDDEEFYLPCVLSLESVEAFLGAGLGWLYHYNYERVHSGYGMAGRTPYGCCVALGFEGSEYVGLMPVVLLDNIVLEWSREGVPAVNDVLTQYIGQVVPAAVASNRSLAATASERDARPARAARRLPAAPLPLRRAARRYT